MSVGNIVVYLSKKDRKEYDRARKAVDKAIAKDCGERAANRWLWSVKKKIERNYSTREDSWFKFENDGTVLERYNYYNKLCSSRFD